ncbi:MAG: hypothetical protein Q4A28_08195, partial [Brachymonas sp.]|nr:hypothetical protein [Brachymonas sp.]
NPLFDVVAQYLMTTLSSQLPRNTKLLLHLCQAMGIASCWWMALLTKLVVCKAGRFLYSMSSRGPQLAPIRFVEKCCC